MEAAKNLSIYSTESLNGEHESEQYKEGLDTALWLMARKFFSVLYL